jgi:2-polyprenyl-3-methyl-5-hydroxy-6-metoxy-1,4-benzoquinol methylase
MDDLKIECAEKINKTQLDLTKAEERQLLHRDYLAHCLRWSYILRNAEIGETILDLGCADAPLAMAFYTNKYKPSLYVGVDIRSNLIEKNKEKKFNFPTVFLSFNIIQPFNLLLPGNDYTIIALLEVLEHVEQDAALKILDNVATLMTERTTLYVSTPCFDGGKAANHVYERTFNELKQDLEQRFTIQSVHGTFASQKDIKPVLSVDETNVFNKLHDYYDSKLMSIFFAPLHPAQSRNCLWTLRKKS